MRGAKRVIMSRKAVGGSRREVEEERKEGRGEVRKEEERSRKLLHEFS